MASKEDREMLDKLPLIVCSKCYQPLTISDRSSDWFVRYDMPCNCVVKFIVVKIPDETAPEWHSRLLNLKALMGDRHGKEKTHIR